jgi:excisionase family DNA binding protein
MEGNHNEMTDTLDLLNLHETAQLLKVSDATIRRMIRTGRLNAYRVGTHPNGGAFRVRRQDAYAALRTV